MCCVLVSIVPYLEKHSVILYALCYFVETRLQFTNRVLSFSSRWDHDQDLRWGRGQVTVNANEFENLRMVKGIADGW